MTVGAPFRYSCSVYRLLALLLTLASAALSFAQLEQVWARSGGYQAKRVTYAKPGPYFAYIAEVHGYHPIVPDCSVIHVCATSNFNLIRTLIAPKRLDEFVWSPSGEYIAAVARPEGNSSATTIYLWSMQPGAPDTPIKSLNINSTGNLRIINNDLYCSDGRYHIPDFTLLTSFNGWFPNSRSILGDTGPVAQLPNGATGPTLFFAGQGVVTLAGPTNPTQLSGWLGWDAGDPHPPYQFSPIDASLMLGPGGLAILKDGFYQWRDTTAVNLSWDWGPLAWQGSEVGWAPEEYAIAHLSQDGLGNMLTRFGYSQKNPIGTYGLGQATERIFDLAYSSDGAGIAVAGNTIRIYLKTSGIHVGTVNDHAWGAVNGLAVAPNGSTLLSNSFFYGDANNPGGDRYVLTSIQTGQIKNALVSNGGGYATAISNSMFVNVAYNADWKAEVRSLGTGAVIKTLPGEGWTAMKFSPNGKLLVCGSGNVYDTATWQKMSLDVRCATQYGVDVSSDGQWAAFSAYEGPTVVRLSDGQILFQFPQEGIQWTDCAFAADKNTLVCLGRDYQAEMVLLAAYDLRTGSKKYGITVPGNYEYFPAFAASPDGNVVAVPTIENGKQKLSLYRAFDGVLLQEMAQGIGLGVKSLTFTPDSKYLYLGTYDGAIRKYKNPYATSLTLLPNMVTGGQTSGGSYNLGTPAPSGGTAVTLSISPSTAASVPSTMTVPAGSSIGFFTVATKPVAQNTVATVTATSGGKSTVTYLNIRPAFPASLTLARSSMVGGTTTSGTVTLNGPAGPGGVNVLLSTNVPQIAPPPSVTVLAGQTAASFLFTTQRVDTLVNGTITAKVVGSLLEYNANTTLTPPGFTLTMLTPEVVGSKSANMLVRMDLPAGPSGEIIYLSSSDSSVTPPASVTIPTGKLAWQVALPTKRVFTDTPVEITALWNGVIRTTTVTLLKYRLVSLQLSASQVLGGESMTGTVTINAAAPSGGIPIALKSSSAMVKVPALVTVPAGADKLTFPITTVDYNVQNAVTITATQASESKTATVLVKP